MDASCPGIDDKHVPFGIAHDFEDVGMTAYEYVRPVCIYELTGSCIISSRISSDMRHQYLKAFAFEEAVERVGVAQVVVVAVAGDAEERLEGSYFSCQFKPAAEVAGMPDLVDRLEERTESLAENPMGIGYEAYISHSLMNIFLLYRITAMIRWRRTYSDAKSRDMFSLAPKTAL